MLVKVQAPSVTTRACTREADNRQILYITYITLYINFNGLLMEVLFTLSFNLLYLVHSGNEK